MFNGIYNILDTILGVSKQGGYDKNTYQYQFNCPCCAQDNDGVPDGKFNLEVNLQILKFQCWRCAETDNTKGRLSKLIKKYGNSSLYNSYKSEIEFIKNSKLYDINYCDDLSEFKDEERVYLPKTFTPIKLSECKDKRIVEYLKKRNIGQDVIDNFNIGYTSWEENDFTLRNRIIIPSYDEFGELNFWTGRDFTDKQLSKYKNCTANKKEIIFQESKINWYAPIVLVEGAIDCLLFPNTIALLGKSLHKDALLYSKLVSKANSDIIIALDNDTDISETKNIYKLLNTSRLKGKIYYVRNDQYKDFGELYEQYGYKGPSWLIKQAKHFNEIDLI